MTGNSWYGLTRVITGAVLGATLALGGCDTGGPGAVEGAVAASPAGAARTAGEQPFPVTAAIVDGLARVEWEPYAGPATFRGYRIQARRSGNTKAIIAGVEDAGTAQWVDSAYVGGFTQYAIEVVTGEGSTTAYATLNESLPEIAELELTTEGGTAVTWARHRVAGNFASYVVERAPADGAERFEPIASAESIDDTTFVDAEPNLFGTAGFVYRVRVVPQVGHALAGPQATAHQGEAFASFDAADVGPHGLYLYEVTTVFRGEIRRYDLETLEHLASREGPYSRDVGAEKDGAFVAVLADRGHSFAKLDPLTLEPLSEVTMQDLLNQYDEEYYAGSFSMGGDGKAAFRSVWYDSPATHANGFSIVDLGTDDELYFASAFGQYMPTGGAVSNSGEYVVGWRGTTSRVYRISQSGGVFPSQTIQRHLVMSDAEDQVMTYDGQGELEVLDLPDLTNAYSFPVAEGFVLREVDPATGLVLGTVYTQDPWLHEAFVYDGTTGDLLLRVPYQSSYDPLRLLGGHLLHGAGYALPVETGTAVAVALQ